MTDKTDEPAETLAAIADDLTSGHIDAAEAYDRCLEAGCTPNGAAVHVTRWTS